MICTDVEGIYVSRGERKAVFLPSNKVENCLGILTSMAATQFKEAEHPRGRGGRFVQKPSSQAQVPPATKVNLGAPPKMMPIYSPYLSDVAKEILNHLINRWEHDSERIEYAYWGKDRKGDEFGVLYAVCLEETVEGKYKASVEVSCEEPDTETCEVGYDSWEDLWRYEPSAWDDPIDAYEEAAEYVTNDIQVLSE